MDEMNKARRAGLIVDRSKATIKFSARDNLNIKRRPVPGAEMEDRILGRMPSKSSKGE